MTSGDLLYERRVFSLECSVRLSGSLRVGSKGEVERKAVRLTASRKFWVDEFYPKPICYICLGETAIQYAIGCDRRV